MQLLITRIVREGRISGKYCTISRHALPSTDISQSQAKADRIIFKSSPAEKLIKSIKRLCIFTPVFPSHHLQNAKSSLLDNHRTISHWASNPRTRKIHRSSSKDEYSHNINNSFQRYRHRAISVILYSVETISSSSTRILCSVPQTWTYSRAFWGAITENPLHHY